MFKKIGLSLGVIVLIVGAVIFLRFINRATPPVALVGKDTVDIVSNDSLPLLTGSGMTQVAEHKDFLLSVDLDTGNIEVTNKNNGYVWRSRPTEDEMLNEGGNDLWRANITSPIMFTYVNELASMDVKYGNVYNQETSISVYQLKDGVRIYFDFQAAQITIALDVTLNDYGFTVDVPPYLISDTGEVFTKNSQGENIIDRANSFCLTDFSVFPFLGATRSDLHIPGYLLVPDGPGALIRFENNRGVNSQFVGQVYGSDFAYLPDYNDEFYAQYSKPEVNFPVYGIVKEDNSLMCVIGNGETLADIVGNPAYVQTGFNNAFVRFHNRRSYKVLTNASTGDGYFQYTDFMFSESRTLHYFINDGASADYVGMAKQYRDYLTRQYGLAKISSTDAIPMQLALIGGDCEPGALGDNFVSFTSFEQAKEIIKYFYENGVRDMDISWYGWQKLGMSSKNPNKFPAEGKLGGDKGLTSFVNAAHELGYRVLFYDDNVNVHSSAKGVSLRNETIYNIQGFSLFGGRFLNADASVKMFEKNRSIFDSYGADGIVETGVGRYILSDFNKQKTTTRTDAMAEQKALVELMEESFDQLRMMRPREFLLSKDISFLSMPTESTYLTVLDEAVPFYPIALHGNVEYFTETYDWLSEPDIETLRALEYGGSFGYNMTYEPTEIGRHAYNFFYYNTTYEVRRDEYIDTYNRFLEAFRLIRDKYIIGHRRIEEYVVEVSYEGGLSIIINYAKTPYTYNDQTINGRDFYILWEGAEE